jgi:hypothetical protein
MQFVSSIKHYVRSSKRVPMMTPNKHIAFLVMFFSRNRMAPMENETTTPDLLTTVNNEIIAFGSDRAKK